MKTKLPLFKLKLLFPVEKENRKTSNTNLGSFVEKIKAIQQFCFGTLVQQNMTQRARGRNRKEF